MQRSIAQLFNNIGFNVFVGLMEMSFFMPALCLTITVYILIIRQFQKVRRKVVDKEFNTTMSISDQHSRTRVLKKRLTASFMAQLQPKLSITKERKCVLNLMAVFSVFLLCWSPLCFLLMVDYYFTASPVIYSLFMLLGTSNSSLNVLIYAGMNQQFRKAYINLLTCKCSRKSQWCLFLLASVGLLYGNNKLIEMI